MVFQLGIANRHFILRMQILFFFTDLYQQKPCIVFMNGSKSLTACIIYRHRTKEHNRQASTVCRSQWT